MGRGDDDSVGGPGPLSSSREVSGSPGQGLSCGLGSANLAQLLGIRPP